MTVLVTTSLIFRTVVLPSRFDPVTAALAVFGVVHADVGPAVADPGTSVNRLDFSAASQSNGDRIDRALHGDLGESTPPQFERGEVGMLRLGKLRFVAGAERGYWGPWARGLMGAVLPRLIFGDFIFSITAAAADGFCSCSWSSHLQLTSVFSDVAVDGALSTSPFSCSEDDDSAVLVVLFVEVDVEVDVRFMAGILPVSGGDCSEMDLRKSK